MPIAGKFNMDWKILGADDRMKVLLMVSRFGYCLNDLLYCWKTGVLPINVVGVVSNHFDYQKLPEFKESLQHRFFEPWIIDQKAPQQVFSIPRVFAACS